MSFSTADSEAVRIDSSGQVGIGTTSPGVILDIQDSGDALLRVKTTGTGTDDAVLRLQIGGTSADSIIQFGDSADVDVGRIAYHHSDNSMRFFTNASEDMRLSGGSSMLDGNIIAYSTQPYQTSALRMTYRTLQAHTGHCRYLRGVTYTWNAGSREGKRYFGVIAQEVEQVIPEIVHDTTMPLLGDEETVYKTVDYEKLCAVLINAVSSYEKKWRH